MWSAGYRRVGFNQENNGKWRGGEPVIDPNTVSADLTAKDEIALSAN